MPSNPKAYFYGMVVQSTIHKMCGTYPIPDEYGEIAKSYYLPGGEAGNSAVIMKKLGYRVKLDGPWLGSRTRDAVLSFYRSIGVDCSGMHYEPDFPGVEDLVIVAGGTRTVLGTYADFYSRPGKWTQPDEQAISESAGVGLDPFFMQQSEQVAQLCVKHAVPYVTIDCAPDSYMCRNAAAVVISGEYIRGHYPQFALTELLADYAREAAGLIIFTAGSRDILFCRGKGHVHHFRPYTVEVSSTLGAGDTFRAGVLHGVIQGWSDPEIVKFGAATAACVCTKFPVGLNPPALCDIMGLMASQLRH